MKFKLTILIFFTFLAVGNCQQSIEETSKAFDALAQERTGLDETLRIDIEGLQLNEYIATIADEYEINVSVSQDLDTVITSNFYDLVVKDIFLFLIKQYQLEVKILNGIIVFTKAKEKPVVVAKPVPKKVDVSYNKANNFLTLKLKNDSLPAVTKAITDLSGQNIVLAPEIKEVKVSSYILNRPLDQVLEMMAKSNDLALTVDENAIFYLGKAVKIKEENTDNTNNNRRRTRTRRGGTTATNGDFNVTLDDTGFINIRAFEASTLDVLKEVSELLQVNFFLYTLPDEGDSVSLIAKGITYDVLLNHMFKGKKYTYKLIEDLYLFGAHTTEGLRETRLIQLENRTIETVLESLPQTLVTDLEVKEFPELNGFVVSGSPLQLEAFALYINEIDRVVPVVQIEVLIVQYQKSYDVRTGLQLGIDQEARTTQGVLLPSTDVTLNATSVNNLIDSFNGLGWINLGKVTKDFYANLKAMESNSMVKISSTPKLVTLNGHEANSTIGETNYYFEQNNQLVNQGVNNSILQSGTWRSTDANLSINIKPVVSKDEHVTLDIQVERSSFLGRSGENAPPGKATQRFESMIRVKNNEMVLLGGLDELENENSGSGAPLLSRVPLLKWFFSNRTKRKDKSKLHLFIKPTVVY